MGFDSELYYKKEEALAFNQLRSHERYMRHIVLCLLHLLYFIIFI
jgi:hypothetical protein